MIEAPFKNTQGEPLLTTNAPATAGLTLYQDKESDRLYIDINNMNVHPDSFEILPTKPITIEILCPPMFKGETPDMTVLSPQSETPTIKRLKPNKPGYISIEVSSIDFYACIVMQK